jgi:hypothetical protein
MALEMCSEGILDEVAINFSGIQDVIQHCEFNDVRVIR